MKNYFFLLFSMVVINYSFSSAVPKLIPATNRENAVFTYYVYISNVSSREDVVYLEELVAAKQSVEFFKAERFPVRCFVLKTSRVISEKEFSVWIGNTYKVMSFGEGEVGKEKAYLFFEKSKKSKD